MEEAFLVQFESLEVLVRHDVYDHAGHAALVREPLERVAALRLLGLGDQAQRLLDDVLVGLDDLDGVADERDVDDLLLEDRVVVVVIQDVERYVVEVLDRDYLEVDELLRAYLAQKLDHVMLQLVDWVVEALHAVDLHPEERAEDLLATRNTYLHELVALEDVLQRLRVVGENLEGILEVDGDHVALGEDLQVQKRDALRELREQQQQLVGFVVVLLQIAVKLVRI